MDFIHIWHDGRYRSKVFISTIPTPGVTLGSRSQNFHKKVKVFCVEVYIAVSSRPSRNFIYIWHVDRYQPRVLLSMIPTLGVTEVKVTNLEFSYKSKNFCFLVYIAISSIKFHYPLTERLSGYSYQQGICSSVRPLKHYSFILYFCLRVKVFTLKFIRPYIMKTLWYSFIFGLMVDIGLKFLSTWILSRG